METEKRRKVETSSSSQGSFDAYGAPSNMSQSQDFENYQDEYSETQSSIASQPAPSRLSHPRVQEPVSFTTAPIPVNQKSLRACMWCSLVMKHEQFLRNGCPNCPFLDMKEDNGRVQEATTTNFDGLIAMMNNSDRGGGSWVARWQRISGVQYSRGLYAISVNGVMNPDLIKDCEEASGKRYHPRTYNYG